jgi:hypothetical protein
VKLINPYSLPGGTAENGNADDADGADFHGFTCEDPLHLRHPRSYLKDLRKQQDQY